MQCSRCNRSARYIDEMISGDPTKLVMLVHDHADAENFAYYCDGCHRGFCGRCCHPKWEALKEKEGLTGRQMAVKLDSDPDACFYESATCPVCKRTIEHTSPPDHPRTTSASSDGDEGIGIFGVGVIVIVLATIVIGVISWYQSGGPNDSKTPTKAIQKKADAKSNGKT